MRLFYQSFGQTLAILFHGTLIYEIAHYMVTSGTLDLGPF